jgi:phage terminase Nu1 subunit (DNA packaging protein)
VNLEKLTQAQLAALFEVEDRTVRNWGKEDPPLPSHGSGKSLHYRWSEAFRWWRDREYRSLMTAARTDLESAGIPPIASSEARRQHLAAERDEIKLAAERKEVAPITAFEERTARLIVAARTHILSIPNRLRSQIGPESTRALEEQVQRTLRILAKGSE